MGRTLAAADATVARGPVVRAELRRFPRPAPCGLWHATTCYLPAMHDWGKRARREGSLAPTTRQQDTGSKRHRVTRSNATAVAQLQDAQQQRTSLLLRASDHLAHARAVQLTEVAALRQATHTELQRRIADGQRPGSSKPAPARWRPVARAWARVVQAIERGALHRATQLAVQAEELHEQVLARTTDLVAADVGVPPSRMCAPAELRARIRELLETAQEMADPAVRARPSDPWWMLWAELGDEEDDTDEEAVDAPNPGE